MYINVIAKIKIKLRPKADESLATWKEKLLKGKKEGTYSYKFKSERKTIIMDHVTDKGIEGAKIIITQNYV